MLIKQRGVIGLVTPINMPKSEGDCVFISSKANQRFTN